MGGKVHGVAYQNETVYAGPKMLQNNTYTLPLLRQVTHAWNTHFNPRHQN